MKFNLDVNLNLKTNVTQKSQKITDNTEMASLTLTLTLTLTLSNTNDTDHICVIYSLNIFD